MKSFLIFCLTGLAAAAVFQQRAVDNRATVSPFLAPACEITGVGTKAVCDFPNLSLSAGKCQDVTYKCVIHPPTSFVAQLDQATSKRCYIAVFPDFGCLGKEVDSEVLGTTKSGCTDAPYFRKITGGVPSSSVLPFGFKSAKLVCA
ncbi:hypothetical protein EsDP_00006361 [Epichloe bromicola]|uniref:Uncharacterized protein n=1 Tax=Epichloe bromicola TaxID=79588 RepID=A0ABQ0CXE3_9HYPO